MFWFTAGENSLRFWIIYEEILTDGGVIISDDDDGFPILVFGLLSGDIPSLTFPRRRISKIPTDSFIPSLVATQNDKSETSIWMNL